ncbi:hypothetical protein ScPMuIL_016159 [Solemya velum]
MTFGFQQNAHPILIACFAVFLASATPTTTTYPGCNGVPSAPLIGNPDFETTLLSPGHPRNYTNNLDCTWEIVVSHGYHVKINIYDLQVEDCDGSTCGCDRLVLYDNSTSSNIATICGTKAWYQIFYSSQDRVWVHFTTDESNVGTGFVLTFKQVDLVPTTTALPATPFLGCTGTETVTAYTNELLLKSPNYPNNYYNDIDCTWEIRSSLPTYHIKLDIRQLNVEVCGGAQCSCDRLVVYDNYTGSEIARLCGGSSSVQTFYSSGDVVRLQFYTDNSNAFSGFELSYSEVPRTPTTTSATTTTYPGCMETKTLTAYSIKLTLDSPNYPNNYYNNLDCTWQIITSSYGYKVEIVVQDLNLEDCGASYCNCDKLVLYDNSTQTDIATLCQTSPTLQIYYSSGNVVLVHFHTDRSNVETGFRLQYREVYEVPTTSTTTSATTTSYPGCVETETLTTYGSKLTLESPNYPNNYYNNLDCTWQITASYGYHVEIVVQDLNLEVCGGSSCTCDKLVLYDNSTQTDMGVLCEMSTSSETYYSSGSTAWVHFHTDGSNVNTGFRLKFREVAEIQPCVRTINLQANADFQTIRSPNYPGYYENNLDCTWQITASYGYHVEMVVHDLSLEVCGGSSCTCDKLVLYDNSTQTNMGVVCQMSTFAHTFYSSGRTAWVHFHTDGSNVNTGFRLQFREVNEVPPPQNAYCAHTQIYADYDLQRLDFPKGAASVESNVNCTWAIHASHGYPIVVQIANLMLRPGDRITIYNGGTWNEEITSVTSNDETNQPTYISTVVKITIQFHSGSQNFGTSQYSIVFYETDSAAIPSCAYNVPASRRLVATALESSISSPNYPNDYPNNEDIMWVIWSKPDNSDKNALQLEVEDAHLEDSNCIYDYVEVDDGCYNMKGKFCGYSEPTYTLSYNSFIIVRFKSDSSSSYRGFKMNYYLTYNDDDDDDDDDYDYEFSWRFLGIILGSGISFVAIVATICFVVIARRKKPLNKSLDAKRRLVGIHNPCMTVSSPGPVRPPSYSTVAATNGQGAVVGMSQHGTTGPNAGVGTNQQAQVTLSPDSTNNEGDV